jgi:peptidoglycan L-alanyl-D-glutamate endopeptidase CwlK
MDKITIERIKLLHPKIREEVMDLYINKVCPALSGRAICRFAYTLRTFKEQDTLYAQGRTKLFDSKGNRLGKVTKAKGGQSCHNYGLAFDIVLIVDNKEASWDTVKDFDKDGKSDWMEVVNIFKAAGYTWGGDWKFKDSPHLEKTFGLTWKDMLALHSANKVTNGYINI